MCIPRSVSPRPQEAALGVCTALDTGGQGQGCSECRPTGKEYWRKPSLPTDRSSCPGDDSNSRAQSRFGVRGWGRGGAVGVGEDGAGGEVREKRAVSCSFNRFLLPAPAQHVLGEGARGRQRARPRGGARGSNPQDGWVEKSTRPPRTDPECGGGAPRFRSSIASAWA